MKATSIYDYNSIILASTAIAVMDGQNGAFARESLISVSSKIHKFIPNDVTVFDLGISVDNTGGYANAIKSLRSNIEGDFRKNGTSSDTAGKISISGDSNLIEVDGYDAESDYTVAEQNQAVLENRNLHGELLKGHQTKYLRGIDESVFLTLIDNTNGFTRETSPTLVSAMTNEELSNTFHNLVIKQRNEVSTAYECNVIAVPKALKLRCDSSDYKAIGEKTISQKLMDAFGVKLVASQHLKGEGAGGTDAICAFNNSDESMVIRIPKKLGISPLDRRGNRFYFEGSYRFAGLDILELGSGYVVEGL